MMSPHPELVLCELTRLLRRICECESLVLTPATELEDIPGIDSLRLLGAVAHLEEYFSVEIDVAALDDLRRVRDILNAVAAASPMDSRADSRADGGEGGAARGPE
jgi:acyl carrier protein